MRQIFRFVLVVVATAMLCSVTPASSLPYGDKKTVKHKLILAMRNSEKDQDKLDKLRDSTLDVPITSSQVPHTRETRNEEESETTTSQSTVCSQKSRMPRKFRSCKSLQEVLSEHFSRPRTRLDASYNSFTLAELFYSGLLEGPLNNDRLSSRQHIIRRGNEVCESLLKERLKPRNVSSGVCSWHYTCTYNPDFFPSFKIEAQINQQEHLNNEHCRVERMHYVTVFKKEVCQEDPCRSAENWVEKNNQEIVVSFKAA